MVTGNANEHEPGHSRGPYAGAAKRRTAIIDAAFKVFSEHGYTGGSLQKVADVVGMSQTSLLHYFPKKSDLLLAVLERRDAVGDISASMDGSASEITDNETTDNEITDSVLQRARTNETIPGLVELYTVLAGEAVTRGNPGRPYITQRLARLRQKYEQKFQELKDAGRLRSGVTPEVASASLLAMWEGLQLQWLLDPDSVDVASYLKQYLDTIILTPDSEGKSSSK